MTAQIDPPNYTSTPNVLLDTWMPKLSGAEFKVLMLIVRETFGWHRDWTKNKHATQAAIVTSTGLSIGAVKLALAKLLSLELIESRPTGKVGRGGQGLEYRILVNRQPLTDNHYPIMVDAQQAAYGSTIDGNGDPLYIPNKESLSKESEGAHDAPAANDARGDAPQPRTAAKPKAARKPRDPKPPDPLTVVAENIMLDLTGRMAVPDKRHASLVWPLVNDIRGHAGDNAEIACRLWLAFVDGRQEKGDWKYVKAHNARDEWGRWAMNGGAPKIAEIVALVESQGGAA